MIRRRLFMEAIRIRSTFRLQLANFFMTLMVLLILLWDHLVVANPPLAYSTLYDKLVQCQDGTKDEDEQDGRSSVILVANYNPPPYKHGLLGLASLVTYTSDKNPYSPIHTPSTTV